MKVKAILVAGGHGSRLAPFTRYTQKTLLPIHERPVIDYALGTIRRAGIQDITIIANRFIGQIAQHVGTGLPGERIHYVMEEEPLGVDRAPPGPANKPPASERQSLSPLPAWLNSRRRRRVTA